MTIINATGGHDVNVHDENGKVTTYPAGPTAVRVMSTDTTDDRGIVTRTFSGVAGLPDAVEGVQIIVSLAAAMYILGGSTRTDLLVVGPPVFDEDRRVVGCRGLINVASVVL